jgi:hypothetical protein
VLSLSYFPSLKVLFSPGGDVVNLFGLDTDYIGRLDKWLVLRAAEMFDS